MKHTTGYYCWLMGLRTWHRTESGAVSKARANENWCQLAQVIEVATGRLCYGRPQ